MSTYLTTTFINNKQTYTLISPSGSSYGTFTDGTNTINVRQQLATTSWKLFSNNATTSFSYQKHYGTKITLNSILVRNYIPCYRKSDNKPGLYDLVNGVFYTNAGTGEFKYPRLPSEFQEVEYIQSTGTQYIDTGVLDSRYLTYDLKLKLNNTEQDSNIIGSFLNGDSYSFNLFKFYKNTQNFASFRSVNGKITTDYDSNPFSIKILLDKDNNSYQLVKNDIVENSSQDRHNTDIASNFYIFSANSNRL
jgi:hypothetical protein